MLNENYELHNGLSSVYQETNISNEKFALEDFNQNYENKRSIYVLIIIKFKIGFKQFTSLEETFKKPTKRRDVIKLHFFWIRHQRSLWYNKFRALHK